jgi:hypothetical protein
VNGKQGSRAGVKILTLKGMFEVESKLVGRRVFERIRIMYMGVQEHDHAQLHYIESSGRCLRYVHAYYRLNGWLEHLRLKSCQAWK